MATKRISKKWLRLDPTDPQALTGRDIWYDDTHTLEDVLNQKLSAGAPIPVSRVGDLTYIPLSITGEYKGVAQLPINAFFYVDPDGTLTVLRPAWDGMYSRFTYALNTLGDAYDLKFTEVEYRPSFLAATEYISNILCGNEYGILVEIRDIVSLGLRKYYFVNLNGSLDYRYHAHVDFTNLVVDNNYKSILRILPDRYVACYLDGNDIHLVLLDQSYNVLYDAVHLNPVSDIVYEPLNGVGATNVDFFVNTEPVLFSEAVSDTQIRCSLIVGLTVSYGQNVVKGHMVLSTIVDSVTSLITNETSLPYNFNPADPVQPPVFANSNVDNFFTSLFKFGDKTLVYWTNDVSGFNVGVISDSFASVLQNFSGYPPIYKTYVYEDVSYLGKELKNVRWWGTLRLQSKTRSSFNADEITDREVDIQLHSTTPQISLESSNDTLLPPKDVDETQYPNLAEASISYRTDSEWVGIIQQNDSIISVNITNDGTSVILPLPDNFIDQLSAVVLSDLEDYDYYTLTYHYIGDGYFIVPHILYNNSGDAKERCVIVRLSGTSVSRISSFISCQVFTLDSVTSNLEHSGVVFYDAANEKIYGLVTGANYAVDGTQKHNVVVFEYNKTLNNLAATTVTQITDGAYITLHDEFGPCITEPIIHNTRVRMLFQDFRSEPDISTRLVNCFSAWRSLNTPTSLFILTIKPSIGFKLYVPSMNAIIRGITGEIPATQINLDDIFSDPRNKTFYLYAELIDNKPTVTVYDSKLKETFSRLLLATIQTDSIGIASINVRHSTRFDVFTPSITPLDNAIVVADDDGHINRGWLPDFPECNKLVYYNGFDVLVRDRSYSKLLQGVAQLEQVTTSLYQYTINFEEPFTNPPIILATPVNAADGYTGSGNYDELTSWFRIEVINVSATSATVQLRLGQDFSGGTFWVHWIAIGN